jgi:hypothetical protein
MKVTVIMLCRLFDVTAMTAISGTLAMIVTIAVQCQTQKNA